MRFSRRRSFPATVRPAPALPATVLSLALLLTLGSGRAEAQSVQQASTPVSVPAAELRLVGGTGIGLEAAASLRGDRLRLDAGLRGGPRGGMGEGAVLVRVLGSAANGLWLRGGVLHHRVDVGCGVTDRATAWDLSLAYRKRWAGGSLFAVEGGGETVSRPTGITCNDSVLTATSGGVRFSAGGQYALTPGLGLYGRIGLRTGQHVMEIGFLPEILAGVAFEF